MVGRIVAARPVGIAVHRQEQRLQFRPRASRLSGMTHQSNRLQPLPIWLRWVMAVVLVCNVALAPIGATHAMASQDSASMSGMGTHCHHHVPPQATHSKTVKHSRTSCPCCGNGAQCQCGCISLAALPALTRDQGDLVPPTLLADRFMPRLAGRIPGRLLRPPIC